MRGKVLFTKKNTKGIYGFITCDDGSSHYFDTSSIVKGNFIKPNLDVEFEVVPSRDGKTQAINVQIVHEEVDYAVLPQDKIEAIIEILNDAFLKRGFIDCAMLPDYFKRVEVNYKEYAEDIRTFVDKYLYSEYTLKKPFVYEGKTYPMALVTIKSVEIDLDTANVKCSSMEGFLQSLKFKSIKKQKQICFLSGKEAKESTRRTIAQFRWRITHNLYWQGERINRFSDEYQKLIDRAYDSLSQNSDFEKALRDASSYTLTHSIGKTDKRKTVLTEYEFISRLERLRKNYERRT